MGLLLDAVPEQYRPLLQREIALPAEIPYPANPTYRQWYVEGYREGWGSGILPMMTVTKAIPEAIIKGQESSKVWRQGFQDGKKAGFHAFQEYDNEQTSGGDSATRADAGLDPHQK